VLLNGCVTMFPALRNQMKHSNARERDDGQFVSKI
jgi:hypothetical protein